VKFGSGSGGHSVEAQAIHLEVLQMMMLISSRCTNCQQPHFAPRAGLKRADSVVFVCFVAVPV
jgi:hypothetical protein